MTTQTSETRTDTRANGADRRARVGADRDPLEEPFRILMDALVIRPGAHDEEARRPFFGQYDAFNQSWPEVKRLMKAGETGRAIGKAWGIANANVLCDGAVMRHFIYGAYVEYLALQRAADDELAESEDFEAIENRLAQMEENLVTLMGYPEDTSREQLIIVVSDDAFEAPLQAVFDQQRNEQDADARKANANTRKYLFLAAKSVFGKSRALRFSIPQPEVSAPAVTTKPVKTAEERQRERDERERRRDARREASRQLRNSMRGASGGGGASNSSKGKGKK